VLKKSCYPRTLEGIPTDFITSVLYVNERRIGLTSPSTGRGWRKGRETGIGKTLRKKGLRDGRGENPILEK
jgi:hypothetical protein